MAETAGKKVKERLTLPDNGGKNKFRKNKSGKNKFAVGFSIYMLSLFCVVLVGLALFWRRMDAYEQSRPEHEMEALLARTDGIYWRGILVEQGVGEHYADTLELENTSFYKRMDFYTDEEPVYGIRFGKVDMLIVRLKEGQELSFGYHLWQVGGIDVLESSLCIYAPSDAVLRVHGQELDRDCLIQENVQELSLGIFEQNRQDIGGLARYQPRHIYDMDGVTVEDSTGNLLELSYSSGNSYYYPPLTDDYTITVPTGSTVTVNGIVLDGENASAETRSNGDFEGIEDFLPFVPGQDVYRLEGLIMPPEVTVKTAAGNRLVSAVDGRDYLYEIEDEIPEALSEYVMDVFDAYVAYSGNRDGNLAKNYYRYMSFLVPDSEAAKRAYQAQSSLQWAAGRDTRLKSAGIRKYAAYSDELFACQINFSLVNEETEDTNAYLFIFCKYNGEWRVVRILNKTSYLLHT